MNAGMAVGSLGSIAKLKAVLIWVIVFLTSIYGDASAEDYKNIGKWVHSQFGKSNVYWTLLDEANQFKILCVEGPDNFRTVIDVKIDGKLPPPNSNGEVYVDGQPFFQLTFDEESHGRTDSMASAGNFKQMWKALRNGKSFRVVLSEGRAATFSLEGSSKIMPSKPCPPDTERSSLSSQPKTQEMSFEQGDILFCSQKWGDDYSMREYCQNEQAKARNSVIYVKNSALRDGNQLGQRIYAFCFDRWKLTDNHNADWVMVDYCFQEQLAAAGRLLQQGRAQNGHTGRPRAASR